MPQDPKAKSEYDRESYAFWKSQHRCKSCHGQDAYTLAGRTLCAECAEKNKVQKAAYRERNRDRLSDTNTDWYYRMKAEHRCVKCASPVEDPKRYVTCAACRAKQRRKHAEKRIAEGANYPRGDNGLCWLCNKRPALVDHGQCAECRELSLRNLEKAHAAKHHADHLWRRIAHAEAQRRAT